MPKYTREELSAMNKAELNQAYRSVRRNLLRNTNKMEKDGATFDMDMRPDIPKKITVGSVMRLQKYNEPGFRAQHATFTDVVTGKVQSWVDHMKEKRSAAGRKANRTKKDKQSEKTDKIKPAAKVSYIKFVDGRVRWMVESVLAGIAPSSTSRHEAQATRLMWNQLKDAAAHTGTEDALSDFLEENSNAILEALDIMYQESDREVVMDAFYRLSQIFSGAMDTVYGALDAEKFQQYAGGWSVYDKNL